MHIEHIPEGVSDRTMQSAYNPILQRAVREFPLRAAYIINEHGLDVQDFEKLQRKASRNILYRYRVQKALKALEKQQQQQQEAVADKGEAERGGSIRQRRSIKKRWGLF